MGLHMNAHEKSVHKVIEKLLAYPLFKRKFVVYSRALRVTLYWSRSCVCVCVCVCVFTLLFGLTKQK